MRHLSTVLAFFSLPTPGFQIESLTFSHKQEVNGMKLRFALSQGELENEKNYFQGQTDGENNVFVTFFCCADEVKYVQWWIMAFVCQCSRQKLNC